MTVVHHYRNVADTKHQATLFAIALAERGYESTVKRVKGKGHLVVDKEGKAVAFYRQ